MEETSRALAQTLGRLDRLGDRQGDWFLGVLKNHLDTTSTPSGSYVDQLHCDLQEQGTSNVLLGSALGVAVVSALPWNPLRRREALPEGFDPLVLGETFRVILEDDEEFDVSEGEDEAHDWAIKRALETAVALV